MPDPEASEAAGTERTESTERADLSRRAVMRSAAATTVGLPLVGVGTASADEHDDDPADDPLPTPDVGVFNYHCDPEDEPHYTEVSREPTHEFGEEVTLELESERDGEKIMVGVLKPDPVDDPPVILRATPYVDDLRQKSLRDCARTERLTDNYVRQGYAVAAVSVRGTGGSGGCMELFGPNEQADIDQAVTHLGAADWSNGNVGVIGRSYDGTTPWMPARKGNPYLATVVPFSGVPDVHELMYKRGGAETRGYSILPGLYYVISLGDHNPTTGTGLKTYLSRASCPDNYAQGTAWSSYSGATGEYDPSGYWTARVLKPGVARNYEGSVLMVHGLQDWNVDPSQVYPWTKELRGAGIKTHVYFGQFSHRYPDDGRIRGDDSYNENWADFLLAWFESELKGENVPGPYDPVPEVSAQNSEGDWYVAEEWPPAVAEPTTFYLGTDGDLREEPADGTGSEVVHLEPDDPYGAEPGCDGCATFVSDPFEEAFRFAGEPRLALTATPTGSAAHLTATVFTVDGDDEARRLGWGQVDLRYAQEGPEADTVVPGEELEVDLPIEPLDAVVPAGERLAVVLHQGTVSGRAHSPTPSPVEVETGGENAIAVQAWQGDVGQFPPADPELTPPLE